MASKRRSFISLIFNIYLPQFNNITVRRMPYIVYFTNAVAEKKPMNVR